jgi:hypothetical protein
MAVGAAGSSLALALAPTLQLTATVQPSAGQALAWSPPATASTVANFDPTVLGWVPYVPDEIPLGQSSTLRVALLNALLAPQSFDSPPTAEILGANETVLLAPTIMTATGNDWTVNYTPTVSGPQALVVRGLRSGATLMFTVGMTVRPRFDPIALATSDVLVSRM